RGRQSGPLVQLVGWTFHVWGKGSICHRLKHETQCLHFHIHSMNKLSTKIFCFSGIFHLDLHWSTITVDEKCCMPSLHPVNTAIAIFMLTFFIVKLVSSAFAKRPFFFVGVGNYQRTVSEFNRCQEKGRFRDIAVPNLT